MTFDFLRFQISQNGNSMITITSFRYGSYGRILIPIKKDNYELFDFLRRLFIVKFVL